MRKKGVSPVIATVLLIAMVVVIGLIIFMWFRGMAQEAITKFGGTNIELVCGDVAFDASYSGGTLYLLNTGNVPIYSMKVKMSGDGSYQTVDIKDISADWSNAGINQGGTFSGGVSLDTGTNKITLIPVLIGSSEKGQKTFVCNENQYGDDILV